MIRTLVRRYLFGALVLAAAGSSHAQTLETFAGDRLVDNLPALESPISPHDIMPAADGSIWFLNGRGGRLMRSDPGTPTLTGWPAGAPSYPYERISHFFRGNTGTIYFITIGTVYQFDPVTGAHTWLGPTRCRTRPRPPAG
jgi:streptogramin lyase